MPISTAVPALTLPEKCVELVKAVNSRLLVCTIHSHHYILTLHDTLTSLTSHPHEENHQIAQLVPCQNKQGRMVQFSTNACHKAWASPSISSQAERAQQQCHMLHLGTGHPKSFSTPASLGERNHYLPILSLLCHLCDQPLNNTCIETLNFSSTAFHCIFINKHVTILTADCQILSWKDFSTPSIVHPPAKGLQTGGTHRSKWTPPARSSPGELQSCVTRCYKAHD